MADKIDIVIPGRIGYDDTPFLKDYVTIEVCCYIGVELPFWCEKES